jgi:hypothetical protein
MVAKDISESRSARRAERLVRGMRPPARLYHVGCDHNALKKRICCIRQLHLYALQRRACWLDVQQVQDDRLIVSKHVPTGYQRGESVADLTCVQNIADERHLQLP